ncbi:nuclear transport factor 2 family protein [Sphingomonas sp. JC676]|uniref:nuclear transport factor 2 family protein n=1 Tax=Sphingomonas sp. JC676 TaxID=2768065 RepID=UPI00165784AF|nr:nuclear transport factor 2 family protein [Sphingomonas sp. JC676]MBC9031305.1 nuclear transport factor 2 family protein [Sphingomonas sp. JC676]
MRLPILLALALLAPLPALAQKTPVAPIEKGTALPPPGAEEAAVITPINALFASLAARDGTTVAASVVPEGRATGVATKPDGSQTVRSLSWTEFAANLKPGPERYEERITNPAIEIDGDIAMVWAPYTFLIDGKIHHCGVDHFDLVRTSGGWKILNATWSSRTTGCQ